MEIRVLGNLEALIKGDPINLGTPKQRTVLALLVMRTGRLVTVEDLVDELWPDGPPPSAVANVRSYAASLRRAFRAADNGTDLLVREGGGYRLGLAPENIDLMRASTEFRHAREAAQGGDPDLAVATLTRGLDRWRGDPFAGLPLGPVLAARRTQAEEERLDAVEFLAELRLASARPEGAIPLLRELVSIHPIRERAQLLLVRALRQSGDVTGAMSAYLNARQALLEHLGIEPGPELQELHRDLRKRQPAIAPDGSGTVRAGDPPSVSWLPRAVPDFVGRDEMVDRILKEVPPPDGTDPSIQVIDGMAGSGKTSLVVHVAARLANRYPNGQLFTDLRGHADEAPVTPAAALVTLLRQLGVAAGRIPAEFPERVELWRRQLASRRVVVILDNAADSRQVEPLLPVSGDVLVMITTRRRLLVSGGRPPVSLPVLSEQESLMLLTAVVGAERVKADPAGAAEVGRLCGHLPLAIRLAGTRMAHRPSWLMKDMVHRLTEQPHLLPQFRAEDSTVVDAFAASYEPLDERAKRVFRTIGLHPGEHLDVAMTAALTDLPLHEAADVLDEMVDRHLVEEVRSGRYRLHDLMRRYSVQLALHTDRAPMRRNAAESLVEHMVHSVARVVEPLESGRLLGQLRLSDPSRPDLLSVRRPGDLEWIESQRHNIEALVRLAGQQGLDHLSWRLARSGWRFFYLRGYFDDIAATHGAGLAAARRLGDRAAVALMHNYLASACVRTGSYREARGHLEEVVAIRVSLGDSDGTNQARVNLGVVFWLMGHLTAALDIHLALLRDSTMDSMFFLPNVGLILRSLGRYDDAMAVHRLNLQIARHRQNYFHISNALGHLGGVRYRLGQDRQAERLLRASLALRERTGNGYGRAETLNDLAGTYRHLGRMDEALRHHDAALETARSSGERQVEAEALNEMARTLAQLGRVEEATETRRQALALATAIRHPYEQGRALAGLADHLDSTEPAEARRYRQRALTIFDRMGVPERFEVRRLLGPEGNTSFA
ncbi:DNA-binding SARP family transcriptional activator/Tfp pilus assembly protein PilF [Micromonospora sp. A200]|uniref:AfsR/SARP family transcriptional regulator n=1 Tax=Micromonospora sp. A200 TaxID=2940568 RepID=UPI002474970E|nr:BTAD domain-containing putative transcriptional regulator [Micromonospora sp. A200]MDH6463526.1 DNA-binding SARP family transcriptional activator/Tfp pilus assembly protein PilF [Micromonospora sp. A200]